MSRARPHVVIVGGGFAGLYAARRLRRAAVRVTLIDRHNHHLFQPLLYQVATAGLSAPDIAVPIRRELRKQTNARVIMEQVEAVEPEAKRLRLRNGVMEYDYLLLATGATHAYFGNDHWAEHAPGLKTLADAMDIRRRILLAYEAAELEEDPEELRALLTFVVVGAGPTGVELAGALAEIARDTLAKDFRSFDPTSARVLLLEGGDRVLSGYDPSLSEAAAQQLRRIGVELRLQAMVTDIDEDGVSVGGERIPARTVLWAAGVRASSLGATLGTALDNVGRVIVEGDLSVPGYPEIFVAGDLAHVEQDGVALPGVAPAAMQMGKLAGDNIRARLEGRSTDPFRYVDKGSMATIGRAAAVAESGSLKLKGVIAWLAWLLIHVVFLIDFRNRLAVLTEWAWAYLTYRRNARVVVQSARDEEAGL